jgi:transcription elongation factor S-II
MQISNPETFRENIRAKFVPILSSRGNLDKVSSDETDETITMATNMEKGVYNYAIKEAGQRKIVKKWENPLFVQIYVDRLRTIYLNLQHPDLLEQVRNKEIPAQTLAFMTHQEMRPEHWVAMIEKKVKRDASKYTSNVEASTDMFTCKKCRSKRCTYYEMQTRSADEPATIFITCLDCGKHWKN